MKRRVADGEPIDAKRAAPIAASRAKTRLSHEYAGRYRELYLEEMAAMGFQMNEVTVTREITQRHRAWTRGETA